MWMWVPREPSQDLDVVGEGLDGLWPSFAHLSDYELMQDLLTEGHVGLCGVVGSCDQ